MAVVNKTYIGNCKGPKGDPGEQGPQGIQGANGIRGSRIVTGIAITGTSTDAKTYATGIADSLVNDHYINTYTGNIYRCTKSGDATTAQWVFVGNITGNKTFEAVYGHKWSKVHPSSYDDIVDMAFGHDKLVSFCRIRDSNHMYYYDLNNKQWSLGNRLDYPINAITFGSPLFIAVGEWYIYKSSDGVNWEMVHGNFTYGKTIYDLIYDGVQYIAVGSENTNNGNRKIVCRSYDGDNWESFHGVNHGAESLGYLKSVAFNDISFEYIAIGNDNKIYHSTAVEMWEEYDISYPDSGIGISVSVIDGIYYIGGSKSNIGYSSNGRTWNWVKVNSELDLTVNCIIKDKERNVYIAGCSRSNGGVGSVVLYSDDGINWSSTWDVFLADSESFDNISCVTSALYADGFGSFVGAGVNGEILQLTTKKETVGVTESVEEMYNKSIKSGIIRKTLKQGETEISIEDSRIKEDSILSFYTSIYGVNPKTVVVSDGSVTLTFKSQEKNMEVGVSIDG